MSQENKDDAGEPSEPGSVSEVGKASETVGEALAKVGFKPLRAGRKLVGQGRSRETLRKCSPKTPDSNDGG
jgi:hypothetical protein